MKQTLAGAQRRELYAEKRWAQIETARFPIRPLRATQRAFRKGEAYPNSITLPRWTQTPQKYLSSGTCKRRNRCFNTKWGVRGGSALSGVPRRWPMGSVNQTPHQHTTVVLLPLAEPAVLHTTERQIITTASTSTMKLYKNATLQISSAHR